MNPLAAALEHEGLLLQHDQVLPSATRTIVGGPVRGSWWAHPQAHEIYEALNDLEHQGLALVAKLVGAKATLVARRLWPDLVAVGSARAPWQSVSSAAGALLASIDGLTDPLVLDAASRPAGKELEASLLAHVVEVHLPSGRHAKALLPWTALGIVAAPDPAASQAAFERIVDGWGSPRRALLPWR